MLLRDFLVRITLVSWIGISGMLGCAGGPWGVEKGGHTRVIRLAPSATILRSSDYVVLGEAEGEASTLFLFGLFPVTRPLNPEYALSQAIQRYEGGQSMIDMVIWHETHYYFPIGSVSVWKVEGKVISFRKPGETEE